MTPPHLYERLQAARIHPEAFDLDGLIGDALSRIAELEALMETADTVAADAAYAKGFAEAKRAAVEAVRDTEEPFGESRLMASRREAIASIRATEPKVQP